MMRFDNTDMELHDRPISSASAAESAEELSPEELRGLAPPDYVDPVIEAYKKHVDRTLLVENLRRTVPERLAAFQSFMDEVGKLRGAALSPKKRAELLPGS